MRLKRMFGRVGGLVGLFAVAMAPAPVVAQTGAEGRVVVPSFDLPLSEYMSPEARADAAEALRRGDPIAQMDNQTLAARVGEIRADMVPWTQARIATLRQTYAVDLRDETWGGVPVIVVTPREAEPGAALLIELHGGGFFLGGAGTFGLLEAIPVAAMTGATVVSVAYRQGPEHRFPAASEDVAAVYRVALEGRPAGSIGVFGCSAGGVLTTEALAWFQMEGLPAPAAAGVFCAGADARYGGDSRYVAAALNGVPIPRPGEPFPIMEELYYQGADLRDPLVSPLFSDEILRRFPPTLLIAGGRGSELSAVLRTHARLTALGVEADLHVWDGMAHGFHLNADLPESREALDVIARFFRRHVVEAARAGAPRSPQ